MSAAALLLVACGALLDTRWVRARMGRRARARLLALYARARDRRTLEPLAPLMGTLEESGAALAVGAAASALLYLLLGVPDDEASRERLLVALPFFLGLVVVGASLLRLILLAPRAFLLWLLYLALGAMEWAGRRVLGERAAAERRPFTYAAVLAAAGVLAAGWWVG